MQSNINVFRFYKSTEDIKDILDDIYGIVFEEVKVRPIKKKKPNIVKLINH
ncbi:hypothetical protein ES703_27430 [subsurface metagenome]